MALCRLGRIGVPVRRKSLDEFARLLLAAVSLVDVAPTVFHDDAKAPVSDRFADTRRPLTAREDVEVGYNNSVSQSDWLEAHGIFQKECSRAPANRGMADLVSEAGGDGELRAMAP